MIKKLHEKIDAQEKIIKEFTTRMEREGNSSFRKFASYVEAQLNELPAEKAIELQNDLQRLICSKKLEVLKAHNDSLLL